MDDIMDSTTLPEHQSPPQSTPAARETSPPPTLPTPTLMLNHPSARLSSSPASSPRIIGSPPVRKRSIHPEMSTFMDRGVSPGADFFEDSSEDEGSEWEDDNGTRNFSEVEGLGISNSIFTAEDYEENRGRRRGSGPLGALPPFNQIPAHDSGTATANEEPSLLEHKDSERARHMPLRRFGRVRVVHNRGSGSASRDRRRESMMSNDPESLSDTGGPSKPFAEVRDRQGEEGAKPSAGFVGRHRRNTSESLRADSILNAHVITMQALESLTPTASLSHLHGHHGPLAYSRPKSTSFSAQRHITISPLHTQHLDPDRPAHLPAHFIKTPYPFTAKKEFPRPKTRPRQHVHEDGNGGYDDKKGRHVLGIVAGDGEYDLRSRLERNEDAQGVVRTRGDCVGWKSADGAKEMVVWLSLRRRNGEISNHLEQIVVPNSLTATSLEHAVGKKGKSKSSTPSDKYGNRTGEATFDFDDMFFAQRLKEGYKKLTRSWFLRLISARKLRCIQLGSIGVWSGSESTTGNTTTSRLLAARDGLDMTPDAQSPFTEHNLMHLYRTPEVGKARYTWVHWARRLAASDAATNPPHPHKHAQPLDPSHHHHTDPDSQSQFITNDTPTPSPLHPHTTPFLDTINTIQFIHSFSAARILSVLTLMLTLSVLAALLWIFLGESAWALPEARGRGERVGGGMLIGMLVLGIEGVAFTAWVVGSWIWL